MLYVHEENREPVACRTQLDLVAHIEDRALELWGLLLDPNDPVGPIPCVEWGHGTASFMLPTGREHVWHWERNVLEV